MDPSGILKHAPRRASDWQRVTWAVPPRIYRASGFRHRLQRSLPNFFLPLFLFLPSFHLFSSWMTAWFADNLLLGLTAVTAGVACRRNTPTFPRQDSPFPFFFPLQTPLPIVWLIQTATSS